MLVWTFNRCLKCVPKKKIIVATDDKRIYNHVLGFGGKAKMTSEIHESGTDRCNEVAQKLYANNDLVVNIQGDEPFINPEQISELINLFNNLEIEIYNTNVYLSPYSSFCKINKKIYHLRYETIYHNKQLLVPALSFYKILQLNNIPYKISKIDNKNIHCFVSQYDIKSYNIFNKSNVFR